MTFLTKVPEGSKRVIEIGWEWALKWQIVFWLTISYTAIVPVASSI